jgi:DAACS family dicarboxylate/amino acid:cation (Na+ or H+) symporter
VSGLLGYERAPSSPHWIKYVMDPVGQVFLHMLLMTVIPLVFASLAVGVARLGGWATSAASASRRSPTSSSP